MSAALVVETRNLTKKNRVRGLELEVREGEIYGFLGPNGAGKTTTLKMLLGLVKPSAGTIRIFGESLGKRRSAILRQIGSLIESPSYYGHLTGLENLRVVQRLRGVPDRNVEEALRIVRLEKHRDKKAEAYSLGMKQRLGIAMALVAFPRLLILDEPTNGLDPAGMEEIRELIRTLPGRYGMTVLLSSHLLGEIEQIATSVGIINEGRMVFQGSLDSLRARSRGEIRIACGDNDAAQSLLLEHGYHTVAAGGRLVFGPLADREVAEINRLLVSRGIPVTRIEERRRSLEDIFLDLTGRERSLRCGS
jgi:ABC-2 type transport system ATP-binding protein